MANAYSVPQSMGQYVDPINLNLVNAALGAKQQRYDYNVAKVDSLLSEFSSIELVRDQDKQYLADRVNGVLNTVNKVQKKNMASNNLTREITQYIGTAIDDYVVEQAGNSVRLRAFEQSIAERKEKKPDTYSDLNYTYAKEQAGVRQYLNGDADSFGNIQYSEYKDVNKRINDFVIDVQNKHKDRVVEIPETDVDGNPTGKVIQTTYSGLTPTQVRQLAESQLDAAHMQQVKINGWYNAGTYENVDQIKSNITEVFNNKVSNIEASRLTAERKLADASSLSEEDRVTYQNTLNSLTDEKTRLEKEKDTLLNSPEAAATYIEKERVLTGAIQSFSSLYSETTKVVKDEVYFAQQDLNLKRLKLQFDMDKEKKTEASVAPIITTIPTTTENNIPEIESFVDTSISKYSTNVDNSLAEYKAALQSEADKGNAGAKNLLKEYESKLATKSPGQTDNDIFSSVVSSVDYNSDVAIIGNKNYVAQIKDDKDKLSILLEGKDTARQQGMISHIDATINSKEGLKAFFDNPDTKMMFKGKAYSVRNLLMSEGVIDNQGNKIGDLKTKPNLLRELQKSFYADALLSDRVTGGFSKKSSKYLKELATSLGENYNDIAKELELELGNRGAVTEVVALKPESKTAQYLGQARANGIYDTFSWSDQSLSGDDKTIGKFLRQDYKTSDLYKANLTKFYDKLPTTQVAGVTPQDKENFQRAANLMSSKIGAVNKDATINIRLDGDEVVLSQVQVSTVKGQRVETPAEVRVLKQDFQGAVPGVAKDLSFATEAAFYNIDKLEGKTLKSESIKFFDTNTSKKVYNSVAQVLLADKPNLIPYIDSSSAKQAIYSSNRVLESRYQNFSEIVDNALSKSSNFAINTTVERDFNGNPYVDMKLIDKRNQKVVHSMTNTQDVNIDDFKKVLDRSPQVFYSMMINDIMAREKQQIMLGSKTPSPAFQNLTSRL